MKKNAVPKTSYFVIILNSKAAAILLNHPPYPMIYYPMIIVIMVFSGGNFYIPKKSINIQDEEMFSLNRCLTKNMAYKLKWVRLE